ncbi:MAG: cobalt-precorrin-5B (C(1))-methyltransferase CbiD [Firmicutes bacterium]|nr:cobalt-precorrin-5B (C(1))-methyltransferase CbiD [Bacillota bacterium]
MEDLYLGSMYENVMIDGRMKRLRQGFTTGTCAQAATVGALMLLIENRISPDITVTLPIGKRAHLSVYQSSLLKPGIEASCTIQKDGGDDPDATHGALITVTVQVLSSPGLILDGGEGVGRVTRPGLDLPLGAAAINRIPQKMIIYEAQKAKEKILGPSVHGFSSGLKILVSVQDGEDIAQRTDNSRLGIIGGISILGTTGVVRPYSLSSWKASVVLATKVACASSSQVILVTGSRTKEWVDTHFSSGPAESVVEVARFLGHALHVVNIRPNVRRVVFVAMPGKLTKAAQGAVDLHARESRADMASLLNLAMKNGVPLSLLLEMQQCTTASAAIERGRRFPMFLAALVKEARASLLSQLRQDVEVAVYLIDTSGQVMAQSGPT